MGSKYSSKRSTASSIIRDLKRPVKKVIYLFTTRSQTALRIYNDLRKKKRVRRYNKYAAEPVDDKLVLFEAFMGRKYADSPKAIYEYMLHAPEYSEYRFVWFFKDRCMDEHLFLEENDRTSLVLWGSPEYYETYARAKYWFANSRIPDSIGIKPSQVYVQCWHGTPLKRLGFDIEVSGEDGHASVEAMRERYLVDAARYTYMISPSRYCTEKLISAFGLDRIGKEDIMIEEGYPRNDDIVNRTPERVAEIKRNLGIPEDKKVILYAPTYRDNQHVVGLGYIYDTPIEFDSFREKLGEDCVVLYRTHYFVTQTIDFDEYQGFIYDVSLYSVINDLYIISDVLITDYSSVFFDYGILKRPIIFYMYDLKYYQDELRGFYLTLDELPGPIVETQEELEDKLLHLDDWAQSDDYISKYKEFSDRFTYLDDGHAAERVVKRIFGADA